MIKVNLLPEKKKKKAKPIPTFLISMVVVTLLAAAVHAYLIYYFSNLVSMKNEKIRENENRIAELKEKIKAVEDYEKLNATFQKRKEIIEQLGKNKSLPVKIIDEISNQLPPGVWLTAMDVKGPDINLNCTGFTNTDVVNFVNNLKNSNLFSDVFLQESVQTKSGTFTLYNFKLTFKVKV